MTREEVKSCFEYLRSLGLTQEIRKDGDIRYIPQGLEYYRWIVRYDAAKKNFCIITTVRNSPTYPFDFNTYNAVFAKNYEELQQMTQKALSLVNDGEKQQADMKKKARIKEIEKAAERFEA